MSQTAPTVKVDYRCRVVAFTERAEANVERDLHVELGRRARVVQRRGVHNVLISEGVTG